MGVQGTIRGQKGRGVPRREKKEKKERGKIPDSMAGHSGSGSASLPGRTISTVSIEPSWLLVTKVGMTESYCER